MIQTYMLVLTVVATSGDHDQFCFVIIQFQKVVGHPYLYVLDTGFKILLSPLILIHLVGRKYTTEHRPRKDKISTHVFE